MMDPIARAHRWHNFMTEEGGINDALTDIRKGYFEKAKQLKIGDTEGYRNLMIADKIAEQLESHLRSIITAGDIAKASDDHASRVTKIGKRW